MSDQAAQNLKNCPSTSPLNAEKTDKPNSRLQQIWNGARDILNIIPPIKRLRVLEPIATGADFVERVQLHKSANQKENIVCAAMATGVQLTADLAVTAGAMALAPAIAPALLFAAQPGINRGTDQLADLTQTTCHQIYETMKLATALQQLKKAPPVINTVAPKIQAPQTVEELPSKIKGTPLFRRNTPTMHQYQQIIKTFQGIAQKESLPKKVGLKA